jgi:hypothetical protein
MEVSNRRALLGHGLPKRVRVGKASPSMTSPERLELWLELPVANSGEFNKLVVFALLSGVTAMDYQVNGRAKVAR